METTHEGFGAPEILLNKIRSIEIYPDDTRLQEWYEVYSRDHGERFAFDLDLLGRYSKKGDRILEFGSVPPLLTAAMAKDYDVIGIDIAPERFKTAINKYSLEIIQCDIETQKLPLEDDQFEGVIFNELFEHLRINPIFTLREARRVLKPNGILMLSTPNLRSLGGLLNLLRGYNYSCGADPYQEYSKLAAEITTRMPQNLLDWAERGATPSPVLW